MSTEVVYLQRRHGWCHMKLLPSRRVLCTPYNHAPYHFMQSHIRKVYASLAVTCHLHFWQNDRDLLRATAVTRGWNGYRNKSQHRKLTLEKKIVPPLLPGLEPGTFRPRVRRSNHWAIPASHYDASLTARDKVNFRRVWQLVFVRTIRAPLWLQLYFLLTDCSLDFLLSIYSNYVSEAV